MANLVCAAICNVLKLKDIQPCVLDAKVVSEYNNMFLQIKYSSVIPQKKSFYTLVINTFKKQIEEIFGLTLYAYKKVDSRTFILVFKLEDVEVFKTLCKMLVANKNDYSDINVESMAFVESLPSNPDESTIYFVREV